MTRNGHAATNGHQHSAPVAPELIAVPPGRRRVRHGAAVSRPEERAHDAVHDLMHRLVGDARHLLRPHQAVRDLLDHVGEDPDRPGLQDTPRRVVAALKEMTKGYDINVADILATTFTEEHANDEPIVVQGIRFWSLCEHHLLPFHGAVAVAYIPNGRIVGLSKLVRTVHAFARRLQVQERMTEQIADAIDEYLDARGVAVHVNATHLCMAMRGVETMASTVTRTFRGTMKKASAGQRFLVEVGAGGEAA